MTTNLSASLIEGTNWTGEQRHYVLNLTGSQSLLVSNSFHNVPSLCGVFVECRAVFEQHYPGGKFDDAALCPDCERLAAIVNRPTLDQCVEALKPLFVSAGLVDLDAEDYAYNAAREIRGLYGAEDDE